MQKGDDVVHVAHEPEKYIIYGHRGSTTEWKLVDKDLHTISSM